MDNRTTSLCLTYKWPCNPLLRILAGIPPFCHSLLLCFKIRLEGLWDKDHAVSYIPRKSLFFTELRMYLFFRSIFEFLFWNVQSPYHPHSHSFRNPKWDARNKTICCSFNFIVTKMHCTGFFLFSELPSNACLSFFPSDHFTYYWKCRCCLSNIKNIFFVPIKSQTLLDPLHKKHCCTSEPSKAFVGLYHI